MAGTSDYPKDTRFFGSAQTAQDSNVDQFFEAGLGSGSSAEPEPFWEATFADDIKSNWNRLFPFQFILVTKQGRGYKLGGESERFTLPIPPQALAISTPFAITTSVTMGGIIEEHNGAPLRTITLSGTTGVMPLRGQVARSQVLDSIPSIFAGVVTGANQVITAVSQAGNLLGSDRSGSTNALTDEELDAGPIRSTGFIQFKLLQSFLEAYVARKRAGEKDLHLGFAIWKEQVVYLVTPQLFDVPRTAASPLEYPFTIVLKSWRRISVKDQNATGGYEGHVGARNPNKLAQVVNALETGRRVLEGARNILTNIRADIQNILYTPLRQTMLGIKDAVGTVLVAVDLPTNIISDLREPLLEATATAQSISQLSRLGQRFDNNLDRSVNAVREAFAQLAISSGKADTEAGRDDASAKGGLYGGAQNRNNADPANKVIENPAANFSFFSTIKPSDLNLRPDTIRKIEEERARARNLRRQDYEQYRDDTLRVLADFSDFVGAGSDTYTRTFGLPVRSTDRTPTDDDWEVVHALSAVAQQYDTLAASATINRDQITSLDYVAGLATRSGIAFRVPRSKFLVPFLFGYTLEQMSNQYLGTPDRWHEIATLNGLQAPYVDEVGYKMALLVNGNGSQVTVADGSQLYVGQRVWIASNTVRREERRIQKLTKIAVGQWVVQLNGDDDLDKYSTVGLAFLQAFLPNTVNSQQSLYIPSDTEPEEEDFRVRSIPGIDYFDPLVRSGGVDLLLTQSGDLAITKDGNALLAVGLTNLIQKVRLVLGTPRGALLHHPDYGVGLKPGISTADLSAKDVFSSIQQFFRDDPGFSGVRGVSVRKNGNGMTVRANVGIAATGQFIPIQVDLKA